MTNKNKTYRFQYLLYDLQQDKIYYYRFRIDGVINKEHDMVGKFRTASTAPSSYKITLVTCATTGSNNSVFDRIREEEPLFYLMLGDFHYGNIRRDCSDEFYTHYAAVLGSKRQSELYQGTPIAYMWDDHDYVFHLLITIYCRKFD